MKKGKVYIIEVSDTENGVIDSVKIKLLQDIIPNTNVDVAVDILKDIENKVIVLKKMRGDFCFNVDSKIGELIILLGNKKHISWRIGDGSKPRRTLKVISDFSLKLEKLKSL